MNKTLILAIIFPIVMFPSGEKQMQQKKEFVPEWAKKAIWYQIFPERFYNSDKTNDPDLSSIKGSWPHDYKSAWEVHPWTSDWYKLQPYELENGKDIWFNIQRRRYGGDIQGIIDKLDYLADLGVNALYLNPVFAAPSLHKYDGETYHHVDPHFGPDPDGDKELIKQEIPDDPSTWVWTSADKLFLQLVDEVHKRNMRIIIDGVFNHMGINSWVFKDIVKNQQNSKYKDWFSVLSWNDEVKGTEFKYEGWFGVKELPELREDGNGIVEGPKKYIFDITRRWMDPDNDGNPADGIDGWRLDVAFCVKHEFWKDWRILVKDLNPEAYLTAEVIDAPDVVLPYVEGDEFDAVMNYNFLFSCAEYFIDEKEAVPTTEFDRLLKEIRDLFPEGVAYVMQNLNNSHDTQRMLSHIVNKDKYRMREWGKTFDLWKGSNKNYSTAKPTDEDIRRSMLLTIFQFTYIGAPYIYYGEEAGMWGANDPDCRKPMVWPDLTYENETTLPDQTNKPPDEVSFNKDLYEHYKMLINIRNSYPVLQTGSFTTLITDDKNKIYSYSRELDSEQIIVVLNNSNNKQNVEVPVAHNEYYRDLMNKKIIKVEEGKITVEVPEKWGIILLKDYYRE